MPELLEEGLSNNLNNYNSKIEKEVKIDYTECQRY